MEFLNTVIGAIDTQLIILALLYSATFFIVMLDLWSGVRKAKQRGEYRSSYGLRRTVEKLAKYFNLMLVLTVIDVMQMLLFGHMNWQVSFTLPIIPYLTMFGAIGIGIIELKSIYEGADEKDKGRIQDIANFTHKMMSDKDAKSTLTNILAYMKTNKSDKVDDKTDVNEPPSETKSE